MKDLSGLEVKDYFRILWNRRWYFLIIFALVSIGGTINARLTPDKYRSVAMVEVDIPLSSVTRSTTTVAERKNALRQYLHSRSFIEKMITQTGSYGWGEESNFIMERAVRMVQNNIRIDNTSDRTFKISYAANNQQQAQNITRQFTEELMRVSRRETADRAELVDRFVDDKLAEASEKLREKSEQLRVFRLQNSGKLPDDVNTNTNSLNAARAQLNTVENAIIQAKNNKENLEYSYNEGKTAREQIERINKLPTGTPKSSREVSPEERELAGKIAALSQAEIRLTQALDKWTENHPDIAAVKREISRLEQEISEARANLSSVVTAETAMSETGDTEEQAMTIAELEERIRSNEYARRMSNLDAEIAKMEQQRAELQNVIKDYELRLRVTPTLYQDLEDLLREEARLQKEYETFAAQKLTASITTAAETDRDNEIYRIVDPPSYPYYPEFPDRVRLIWMSLGAGFVLGICAAFGRELLDNTISSEEEAVKAFNLPVLAVIPTSNKKTKKRN